MSFDKSMQFNNCLIFKAFPKYFSDVALVAMSVAKLSAGSPHPLKKY
jgi:hypothetical protein